ncbi:MAG: hypothetical protein O7B25_09165, partial [Gammaproteobacteria bacterium]|nr:hypothetical protein [Gammaproteobacteria bacterium]
MPGGPDSDDSQSGGGGSEPPGWVDMDGGGGAEGDWETSNQQPGAADIPPMPSESGTPGSGDGTG